MSTPVIPENVRRLLLDRIDSVPELEAVLLLRDYRPQEWTEQEVGQRLYVSNAVATYVLSQLVDRGFFRRVGQKYAFAPADPELERDVEDLARTYTSHLIEVTQLIHGKPSLSVRQFADAFRLRGGK